MLTSRNMIIAILVCCSIGAAGWYLKNTMVSRLTSVTENVQVRNDEFANQLNEKIARFASASGSHERAVIFDNDAASDDALALILIGNDPGVSLKAITVAGTGEAHGRKGAENMAAISYMMGKSDIPIAYGHARPLSSAGKSFPPDMREAMDNLLEGKNIQPHPDPRITDNAVGLIKQIVETSNEKVTILATGPLTNIAEFVMQYPQLKNKIEKIVVMGGAVNVPGNVGPSHHAVSEWNFYADPEAAHQVFAAHIPVTLVALDATNQVPITKKFYDSLAFEEQPDLHLAHLILKSLVDRYGMGRLINDIYLWDALAAMVMLEPDIAETTSMPLVVDVTNGQVRNAKNGDRHIAAVNVVTKILKPDAVLSNYVAMVKSNHIYASRQLHYHSGRATANLGRETVAPAKVGIQYAW